MTCGATDAGNLFYSYALAEFWVRAFGCDWLTPDMRPWCRSTASCRRIRCCSPRDASHSSSPSSDAAARGSSQDACWSRLVTMWSVVKHVPCKKRVVQYTTDFLLICMQYTTHAVHGLKRISWISLSRSWFEFLLPWIIGRRAVRMLTTLHFLKIVLHLFCSLLRRICLLSEIKYSFHYSLYLWNSYSIVVCDGSINFA